MCNIVNNLITSLDVLLYTKSLLCWKIFLNKFCLSSLYSTTLLLSNNVQSNFMMVITVFICVITDISSGSEAQWVRNNGYKWKQEGIHWVRIRIFITSFIRLDRTLGWHPWPFKVVHAYCGHIFNSVSAPLVWAGRKSNYRMDSMTRVMTSVSGPGEGRWEEGGCAGLRNMAGHAFGGHGHLLWSRIAAMEHSVRAPRRKIRNGQR